LFGLVYYVQAVWYAHKYGQPAPHQVIYSGAAAVASVLAAATIVTHFGGINVVEDGRLVSLGAVLAAVLTFGILDQALIVAVVYLVRRPSSLRNVIAGIDEQLTEFATLALAVLLAVTIVHAPALAPFTLLLIIVLRRSALVRQLQDQALRDTKTGLLNAGAWREEAERELVRGERVGTPISVLMIDLDHFKRLNDDHGHQAGDTALKAVAGCLTEALRGYDAIGRFGGEEFIALLADADATVSTVVAERLRVRIADIELTTGARVTASIGVGVGVADMHTLDEMIAVADKALYVAKGAGRNRIHVSAAPLPQEGARRSDG